MPTSAEQIDELIAAGNDWQAQALALLTDRVAHQQAYEALANNLVGVVKSQMEFTATVDPDEVAPTNVEGGTFTAIHSAINAAPAASLVKLTLLSDKVYDLTTCTISGRTVEFTKSGAGANPVIKPLASLYQVTSNVLAGFQIKTAGGVYLNDVDVDFTAAKVDAGLPWSAALRGLIRFDRGIRVDVKLRNSYVTAGADVSAIADCASASIVRASFLDSTFDGAVYGVHNLGVSGGVAIVANSGVTTLNGGAIVNNATGLGTNLLMS
ncbi:hypothetical protein [Thalassovita aquimarina]|uniref:Uncharacterized protein n=1 Tax=Thalassovita aquimarina TaxID=2785917 RepID=A0ABS5HSF3_9RHOB|nr:hypothetical protein [Thalassovita aquimarina]MBR9651919.1 hypothetical protein [Thalassovita aquimarina]